MLETIERNNTRLGDLAGVVGGGIIYLAVSLSARGGSPTSLISHKILESGGRLARLITLPKDISINETFADTIIEAPLDFYRKDSVGYNEYTEASEDALYAETHRITDVCDHGDIEGQITSATYIVDTIERADTVTNVVSVVPFHQECDIVEPETDTWSIFFPHDGQITVEAIDVSPVELDGLGVEYHPHDTNDLDLGGIHLDIPDFLDAHLSFPGTVRLTSALLAVAYGLVIAGGNRVISEIQNRRKDSK